MSTTLSLSYAPLVVFTYNRLGHTAALLDSLNLLLDKESTDLYFFSDGPESLSDSHDVNSVRAILKEFKETSTFKSVTIFEQEVSKGLAQSIITGVTDLIARYGRVICLEDDLVVGKGFLSFMNSALDFYGSNKKVWAVSGYTFPMGDLKEDVYFSGRACSWGWATWSDRWEKVDWRVRDYPSFRRNIRKRKDFGRWGADMPDMLDRCVLGDIHSWAIRWCYAAWKAGMLTVYPKTSFVINNGTDGSGTNFIKKEARFDTVLNNDEVTLSFVEPYFDERIRRAFKKRYFRFLVHCKIQVRVIVNQFRKY